ncbi:MAG: fumarylacetoacetate hydrolase family protein [bacterium]|nr:MAG: fumarylacetoacetate hydrolase family protein [bacterium]
MRLVRFSVIGEGRDLPGPRGVQRVFWGIHEGDRVLELTQEPWEGIAEGKARYAPGEVKILPPADPGKIVLMGFNYKGHIEEMGYEYPSEPLIFLKAPSSVIPHGEAIILPPESERVDYEGELALVVGRRCRRVSRGDAPGVVLGCTILNDVTARDLQKKDVQFSRAKSFDTFCPLGPWIETEMDPLSVRITTVVNSRVRQDDHTSTMLFDPYAILEYVSAAMTLMPGDVIATGTPSGVGPLAHGDEVSVTVEGIGTLTNPVVREGM